jgi:hypothetical protein
MEACISYVPLTALLWVYQLPLQVALLFLVRDGSPLPNEPIWRAFLEAAARLQLQPALARAAAKAAQHMAATSVQDVLHGTPLHPSLQPQQPWTYPDYRMQHGLTPGALKLSTREVSMHLKKRISRDNNSSHTSNSSSSSSSRQVPAWMQFSAAAPVTEQTLQENEIERLLQASHTEIAEAYSQQQQTQQPRSAPPAAWDPMLQLSTANQAAGMEMQQQSTGQPLLKMLRDKVLRFLGQRTSKKHRHQQQQQEGEGLQHVKRTHGNTADGESTHDSRRLPLHPVLQQQQLFSVYVHTPHGELLPPGSLFAGCELRWSVNTTNGYAQHVLAEAAVLLLRAALQDRLNTHFVVLSDSSIPIYPPQVGTHHSLLSLTASYRSTSSMSRAAHRSQNNACSQHAV